MLETAGSDGLEVREFELERGGGGQDVALEGDA